MEGEVGDVDGVGRAGEDGDVKLGGEEGGSDYIGPMLPVALGVGSIKIFAFCRYWEIKAPEIAYIDSDYVLDVGHVSWLVFSSIQNMDSASVSRSARSTKAYI